MPLISGDSIAQQVKDEDCEGNGSAQFTWKIGQATFLITVEGNGLQKTHHKNTEGLEEKRKAENEISGHHLPQFTSRSANCNSLPSDVRSTPVWFG